MHKLQQLATSNPTNPPTHGSDKGKNDPAHKQRPKDEKSDSKPAQENPRKPEKTGK